jgi:Tol biopolymer transport system component
VARTLKPEDRISHYRVVGPLGAGGMGEVYRARDQNLPRDVALKILPPELVQSEERVRRFTLEAESASSLNHPHIVTIYEIGEDRVQGSETDSSPLHYISMELVSGKTLAAKIHEEKADLKTLLGWLAQAAEGVAKAHAAGIVHRDLKPGNIMVTSDGYAKVLDFGLAKLTEHQAPAPDPDLSVAATMTAGEHTSEGAVVGTAGYMAPEQVRGQVVDARADVFAFGCMLYEAATRRRPFAADSKVETMHRILHDVPAPIEEVNPEAPTELRRLIRRCLAKDPNHRLDSMRTLALELREIVDEYDALSALASSGSGASPVPLSTRRGMPRFVIFAAVVALAFIAWLALKRPWLAQPTGAPRQEWKQLTFTGDVSSAELSADGKTMSYEAIGSQHARVMVQDILGGQALEIYRGFYVTAHQWTRGGSAVFVSGFSLDSVRRTSIIPRMGGQGTMIPAVGLVRLSPDGATLAYWRSGLPRIGFKSMAGGDTSSMHLIPQLTWIWDVQWSRDGKRLLCLIQDEAHVSIWTISRDGRHQDQVYEDSRTSNLEVRWAPRGSALYCIRRVGQRGELFKIYLRPDGSAAHRTRVLASTPGLLANGFGISDDGHRLICIRGAAHNNLWLWEPGKNGTRRPLTQGTAYLQNPTLSPDGKRVAFLSNQSGSDNIHVLSLVDGSVNQITFLDDDVSRVAWSPDGKNLAFSALDRDTLRVWRVAARGGTPSPLDRCVLGDRRNLTWSPGKLTYGLPRNRNLQVVDLVSGIRRPLVPNDSVGWMFGPAWSPDGKHVAVMWNRGPAAMRDGGSMRGTWIVSTEDTIQRLLLSDQASSYYHNGTKWSADGSAIYVLPYAPPWRVVRVAYPRGDTTTVLRLPVEEDRTSSDLIDITPDLRRVVYAEGESQADVWLLENFDPDVK